MVWLGLVCFGWFVLVLSVFECFECCVLSGCVECFVVFLSVFEWLVRFSVFWLGCVVLSF